ncbi:MAG: hypothetical protein PHY15_07650 [Eubacteriales bacterium]|nr:hypothetical protein [Eubacteriales bacterium]
MKTVAIAFYQQSFFMILNKLKNKICGRAVSDNPAIIFLDI